MNNEEEEKERNYLKQEENESKSKPRNKTPLDLEKLVQPLESKINLYNICKDLKTIIGKIHDLLPVLAAKRRLGGLCLVFVGGLSFDTK